MKRFAYSTLPVIREALREQGKEKLAEKLSLAVGKFLDPEQKSSDFTFRQAELVKVGAEVSKELGKHPLAEASREVFSQIASGSISPLENLLAAKPGDIAVVIDKIGEPELAQAYRDVEKSVSSQSDIKLTNLHLENAELQVLNAVLL